MNNQTPLFRSLFQSLALAVLGVFFIYLMSHYELIDFSMLKRAFGQGALWIAAAMGFQVLGLALATLRYHSILKRHDVSVKFPSVATATAVGTAAGQWLPGSMTLIEAIRVGLMLGAHKEKQSELSTSSIVAKLAQAGFLDRLCGLIVFLFTGGLVLGFLSTTVSSSTTKDSRLLISSISALSLAGAAGLFIFPKIAGSSFCQAILEKITIWSTEHNNNLIQKIVGTLSKLAFSFSKSQIPLKALALPLGISLFSNVCFVLNYKFCAMAIGAEISVLQIAGVIPFIGLASLLPLGFGGIGGYQLVAVALFQPFGVAAANVASTSLVQGGVVLLAQSLVGLLFLRSSFPQVKQIIAKSH